MEAIIIGAGMSGATVAIALHKLGMKATVYESARELKPVGAGITLMPNGLRMIDKYIDSSLFKELYQKGNHLDNLTMITKNNNIMVSKKLGVESVYNYPIISFQRPNLQKILLNKLKELNIELVLGKRLKKFEQHDRVKVFFEDGTFVEGDLVISCDGIHSKARQEMFGKDAKINKTGVTAVLGISKSLVQADLSPILKMDSNNFYQIRDNQFNFICIPQIENKFFWGYVYKKEKNDDENCRWGEIDIFSEMPMLMKELKSKWSESVITKIISNTEKCVSVNFNDLAPLKSWHIKRVALLGDAAHAMTPHLGQGVNMAFEDIACLMECFKKHLPKEKSNILTTLQIENIFFEYEQKRMPRVFNVCKSARLMGYVNSSKSKLVLFLRNLFFKLAIKILGASMFSSLFRYDL